MLIYKEDIAQLESAILNKTPVEILSFGTKEPL